MTETLKHVSVSFLFGSGRCLGIRWNPPPCFTPQPSPSTQRQISTTASVLECCVVVKVHACRCMGALLFESCRQKTQDSLFWLRCTAPRLQPMKHVAPEAVFCGRELPLTGRGRSMIEAWLRILSNEGTSGRSLRSEMGLRRKGIPFRERKWKNQEKSGNQEKYGKVKIGRKSGKMWKNVEKYENEERRGGEA